jgi:hypothetical protein
MNREIRASQQGEGAGFVDLEIIISSQMTRLRYIHYCRFPCFIRKYANAQGLFNKANHYLIYIDV